MSKPYDVIVVGARCAGSPSGDAARAQGLSGAAGRPRDVSKRHDLDACRASARDRRAGAVGPARPSRGNGCPPIDTYAFDFGPFTIEGAPGTKTAPVAYCPRRTVLDKLLLDAAAEAGAEVREDFSVDEVLVEDGRVVGIQGIRRTAVHQRARARSSSAPTGAIRSWRRPFAPSTTMKSRRCLRSTMRTGAACRCAAASKPTSATCAALRRRKRMTA